MFQTNPVCKKYQNIFYDIFYTKNWNQRVFMLIISPFILDDHFLQWIIKIRADVNKYQRCRTKMHSSVSCHARYRSTPGWKESLEGEIHVDQVSYGFLFFLPRVIPCVGLFEREKKNPRHLIYVLFLSMVQKGFVSFLTWISTLVIFNRFFLQF